MSDTIQQWQKGEPKEMTALHTTQIYDVMPKYQSQDLKSSGCTRKEMMLKGLFLLSAVCIFVSCVCLIAVCHHLKKDVPSKTKVKADLCLSCDGLTQDKTIPDFGQLPVKMNFSQNSTQYCVGNSEQMSALLELAPMSPVEQEEPLPVLDPKNFTIVDAFIHKKLELNPYSGNIKEPTVTGENQILGFSTNPKVRKGELLKNMDVKPTYVVIYQRGIYYVYVSAEIVIHNQTVCRKFANTVFNLSVIRKRNQNTDQTLLTARFTYSSPCTEIHETMYSAGLFDLMPNDELQVEFSGHRFLSFSGESNFFGAFKISGKDPGSPTFGDR